MKKQITVVGSSAVIFGLGFSTIISTYLLDIWEIQPQKAAAIVLGIAIPLSLLFFYGIKKTLLSVQGRKLAASLPSLFGILLVCSGLLVSFIGLPSGKTPDSRQFIEIKPATNRSDSVPSIILVEEIKIDEKPVPLESIKPSSGWLTTDFGLQNEAGSQNPLILTHNGTLLSGMELLLARGPEYGAISLRTGWKVQEIDLHQQDGYSEISVKLPPDSPELWDFFMRLALFFAVGGIFILIASPIVVRNSEHFYIESLTQWSESVFFWLILAFLFWYGFSFTRVVFFNSSGMMKNDNFLPAIRPIGNDLNLILEASRSIISGGSPYSGANKYPPFATILFLPLTFVDNQAAFQILTLINYVFYGFITLCLPCFLAKSRKLPVYAWFLLAVGLYSYGLLFEIERGQFNLIAVGCAFLAILIFHRAPRFRWLAYVFFTISIQLKLYPAIFILFLIDDWQNWKKVIIRWIGLGLANIALLFILGSEVAFHYIQSMSRVVISSGQTNWPVSHSIQSFLNFTSYFLNVSPDIIRIVQLILQMIVLLVIGYCFYRAYRRKDFLDPYLLLVCTLGALTIPTLSNDYTLSYLVGPAIYLFLRIDDIRTSGNGQKESRGRFSSVLVALIAFSLCSTFFSYLQKPIPLQNLFPALLTILVCAAILSSRDIAENCEIIR